MVLDLSVTNGLRLRFDPVESESRLPSVAFDIEAMFSMPFQQSSIIIKECWFSHNNLNLFEERLRGILANTSEYAVLENLSCSPIITISSVNEQVKIRIQAVDSASICKSVIDVSAYKADISEMFQKIQDYPKWW